MAQTAQRILGIDTGTNSLGWAVVDKTEEEYKLITQGSHIFTEGVKMEKGTESSRAAERTAHRALRVRYYRIRLRKIELLRCLSAAHLCPPLTSAALKAWRLKKEYPLDEAFLAWQRTDEARHVNPYACRHRCLHEALDLDDPVERYVLGRALYHMAQRRGFLSNRKEESEADSKETGKVKTGISELNRQMLAAGAEYLGDYFYALYERGEKIRGHYTAREEHYHREFAEICRVQRLDETLAARLEHAIFYQRPLKSQKHTVGRCPFEKKKPRCQLSHPLFEELRMLAFINNIKVLAPHDTALRPLNETEREAVMPLFFRKSKTTFTFSEIADSIIKQVYHNKKKGLWEHYDRSKDQTACQPYRFNFYADTQVSGCPVTAALRELFGVNWQEELRRRYDRAEGKTDLQIVNDVWHALTFATDDAHVRQFGREHLGLDDKVTEKFGKIRLPSGYASLSLLAITKILPHLRRGHIMSHATFLANLRQVLPSDVWADEQRRDFVLQEIGDTLRHYDRRTAERTLDETIKDFLGTHFHAENLHLDRLYHPSQIETYPQARRNDCGFLQLGSPRTDSVRNPMAMRSLHRLRAVVNRLLAEGIVDEHTEVHIEFARELNDANRRWALSQWNKNNEKTHAESRKKIIELYQETTGRAITPTDDEVLMYELYEEQGHRCLYTGQEIGITDFIGSNPKYEIEHTIPRSLGGDSTKENLTLCERDYNRRVKRNQLPIQCGNYEEILPRIQAWKDKWAALDKQIRRTRTNPSMDKEAKDTNIRKRHLLTLQRDYVRGKCLRFEMESDAQKLQDFSRRQGTDISVITRLAMQYLRTAFPHVYARKGIATAAFRRAWGLQEIYEKKKRDNHIHHCIDAIVIACMQQTDYARLAQFYRGEEQGTNPVFAKPWSTFTEDLKNISDTVLISHHTADPVPKGAGRRRIRIGATCILSKGDTARGSLHKDKSYGAIQPADNGSGRIKYVLRLQLASFGTKKDDIPLSRIKDIVDPTVRAIVQRAVDLGGPKALQGDIWMNEEKRIPIKKVRCYCTSVVNPLHIRNQRDQSTKEYKRQYHVANDENYMLVFYEGRKKVGKVERVERECRVVTMLEATAHFKGSARDKNPLYPPYSEKGYPATFTVKKGDLVLLYEKTPEELWNASQEDLVRRLYKITKFTSNGRTYMIHHQEARPKTQLQANDGVYKSSDPYRPIIGLSKSNFNALICGLDFELNELGEITFNTPRSAYAQTNDLH